MLGLLVLCLAMLSWLARSRFGMFVRALREDQDAAAALGVNTTRYKVYVFTITTAMAAAAGAVQAHYVQIVTPNLLFLLQMSLVVAMAVIGGVENFVAAALGAIFLQILLELLRTSFTIGGFDVDMTVWRSGVLRGPFDDHAAVLPQRVDRADHLLFPPVRHRRGNRRKTQGRGGATAS